MPDLKKILDFDSFSISECTPLIFLIFLIIFFLHLCVCQIFWFANFHNPVFPANNGFSKKFPGSGATTATLFVLLCLCYILFVSSLSNLSLVYKLFCTICIFIMSSYFYVSSISSIYMSKCTSTYLTPLCWLVTGDAIVWIEEAV